MAEPITFVPLDCHLDEKFEEIEEEFGLKGFAIVVKLFQRIYGGHGYYCKWSDRIGSTFARKIGADFHLVHDVVSLALKTGVFDKDIYENYSVLTSHGIQKRFASAAEKSGKRSVIFDCPEYVKHSCADFSESGQKTGTSKGERMEGKEREDTAASPPAPDPRDILVSLYGESNVEEYEQQFDKWKRSKGGIKVDKFKTIEKWLKRDGVKKPVNNSSFDTDEVISQIIGKYQ